MATNLLSSPKSHPSDTDIQRMDLKSWMRHKKGELLGSGQLQPELANHPAVDDQLADAYRKHYGVGE